jgi:tetratricopeptide (TPR) repeat protein
MEDPAEQYFNEGFDFFQQGHYSEALASFDKAIAIKPDYTEVKKNRENALQKQKTEVEVTIVKTDGSVVTTKNAKERSYKDDCGIFTCSKRS